MTSSQKSLCCVEIENTRLTLQNDGEILSNEKVSREQTENLDTGWADQDVTLGNESPILWIKVQDAASEKQRNASPTIVLR